MWIRGLRGRPWQCEASGKAFNPGAWSGNTQKNCRIPDSMGYTYLKLGKFRIKELSLFQFSGREKKEIQTLATRQVLSYPIGSSMLSPSAKGVSLDPEGGLGTRNYPDSLSGWRHQSGRKKTLSPIYQMWRMYPNLDYISASRPPIQLHAWFRQLSPISWQKTSLHKIWFSLVFFSSFLFFLSFLKIIVHQAYYFKNNQNKIKTGWSWDI